MATLEDKVKIEKYLVTCPDGAHFADICKEIDKPSNIVSYMLTQLFKAGKVTNPEKGVWRATQAAAPLPKTPIVDEPGNIMKPGAEVEPPPEMHIPGAYEKFMQIGRSLGIKEDFLKVACDHVFQRDPYDLNWIWEALNGMYLRPDVTKRWFNMWSGIIRQPIPTELVGQVMPPTSQTVKEAEAKVPTRFDVVGDEIVANPEGEFTFSQARQYLMARAIQGAAPGVGAEKVSEILGALSPYLGSQRAAKVEEIEKQGESSILAVLVKALIEERGGGQQPLTLNDVLAIVDRMETMKQSAIQSRGQPLSAVDELERMANLFSTLKGIFGSRESSTPFMIPIKGANGETGAMPIDLFFKVTDHQREVQHEEEEFKSRQETGKMIRSILGTVQKAASNVGRQ